MIQCDIQGDNCKIWYHGDCVGVSKPWGRRMDRSGGHFICLMRSAVHSKQVCDNSSPTVSLPSFEKLLPPSFQWNETINGIDFAQQVSVTYDVVVHWRHNLFLVPYGRAGKEFVQELANFFRSYGEASVLESIAITETLIYRQPIVSWERKK